MKNCFKKMCGLMGMALICVAGAAANETTLYSTSFENFSTGTLEQQKDGIVAWKSIGKVAITDKHQHTGSKSLHLFGGTDNTMELILSGAAQNSRGIRFQAERWTRKTPFRFRIQAKIGSFWKEFSNLDELILVGGFNTDVVVKLPMEKITGLRLICTAPDNTGVLIDNFRLLKEEPSNVTQTPKVASNPIKKLIHNKALFVSGTKHTHTFRIPAIITAPNGDLIAVCDARRKSSTDLIWARDIDIAIRRSTDNGKSWTSMDLICDFGDGHPASDPSLLLDQTTGEIFCFYNYMNQDDAPKEFRLYVQSSKDNGKTWSKARDITDEIAKPEWKMDFKFITSGRGIQTHDGELLHTMVNLKNGLHIFGSKDHGKSWYLKDVPLKPGNESKVIELADDRLMVNCRHNGHGYRWVYISKDGGKTWAGRSDRNLVDPSCNGSILRYTSIKDGYKKNRLLFCNANSFTGRQNLSVRISYDEGETWSEGKVIDSGSSAYSSLTICQDGTIGILYEPGYKEIRFVSFTLEDLTDGKDKLCKSYQLPNVLKK